MSFATGLGLGLLNAQQALAQMMADRERRLAREQEQKRYDSEQAFRQQQWDYQLGRDKREDEITRVQRFMENATPNETAIDPEMAALADQHGFGSRIKTLPALQARSAPMPMQVPVVRDNLGPPDLGADGPTLGPTPLDALMKIAPQDLSVADRQVVAPSFQQQQALDARSIAARQREEDLKLRADERQDTQNFQRDQAALQFQNQRALQDDAQAHAAALQANALENALEVAGLKGTGKVKNVQQLDALGRQIMANPDLLNELTPTMRGEVLAHIANAGGTLQTERQRMMGEMMQEALTMVRELKTHPGLAGSQGAISPFSPGSIPRLWGAEPAQGSAPSDFRTKVQGLLAKLTVPRMQMMRGLGQMSDKEFAAMQAAASILGKPLSDAATLEELSRIENALATTLANPQFQPADAPPPPGAPARAGGAGPNQGNGGRAVWGRDANGRPVRIN